MRATAAVVVRRRVAVHGRAAMLALCAAGALLAGCAARGRTAQVAVVRATDASGDSAAAVVVVREYPRSPTVLVLGWAEELAAHGIRAEVRRDGSFDGEHALYVDAVDLAPAAPRVATRLVHTLVPAGRQLDARRIARDADHCVPRGHCSPYEYLGVRVPDALLRANRDSLVVRFVEQGHGGSDIVVTLRRGVIDPYLAALDSVAAALRAR